MRAAAHTVNCAHAHSLNLKEEMQEKGFCFFDLYYWRAEGGATDNTDREINIFLLMSFVFISTAEKNQ